MRERPGQRSASREGFGKTKNSDQARRPETIMGAYPATSGTVRAETPYGVWDRT